ncbi:MAG: hypothetical protein Q9214_004257 [Letrouitia sp. 1 TL-2023]
MHMDSYSITTRIAHNVHCNQNKGQRYVEEKFKNSRNAAATSSGDSFRAGYGRRSRSPEYGRGPSQRGSGQRMSGDRVDRGVPYSNFGGEPRRRDDYRPLRSPSPRSYRPRDDYRGRDRSPDRYYGGRRSRSRSPYGRNGRYRSNSPRGRDLDDETNLPIPRRDPRNVPEVQIVLVDEVDRTFVAYIEKTFRDRGLSCGVLQLQRLPLAAVVKRQIIEGVQAVVKILRQSQLTGKIPLQVFDHSGGVDHVRYEEYDELDAHIAAELVFRAKTARLTPSAQQPSMPGYGAMRYGQPLQAIPPPQSQSTGATPNIANLITSLDGPSLQKLLGAINPQSPQTPSATQYQNPQQPANIPDLAALLGNNTQQHQQPQTPQHGYPQYPQSGAAQAQNQAPYSNYGTNTALAALLGNTNSKSSAQGLPQQHQGQPGQQQNVQSIMEQLARYKQ